MCSDALPLTSKGDQKAEILCSKGKSNGKSEVSWYPRATRVGLYSTKIYRRPSRPSGFPICCGSVLSEPIQASAGTELCSAPCLEQGLEVDRVPRGGQQPWESQSVPSGLGRSKAVKCASFISFLRGPSHLHAQWPKTAWCLVWAGGESIKLPHTRM